MSQNQQRIQQQQQQMQQQQQIRQEGEALEDQQGQKEQTIGENKRNKKKRNRRKRKQGNGNVREVETGTEPESAGTTHNSLPLNSTDNQRQMGKPITPIASRKAAGSNWQLAVAKVVPAKDNKNKTNEQVTAVKIKDGENVSPSTATTTLTKAQRHRQKRRAAQQRHVAMDCEMVGVGLKGQDDMLARVSIVNKRGEVLLDKFVKPQETVIDYRTSVSGIRPHDMDNGEDMLRVQDEVIQILQGKILIGHGINKDLSVLRIKHPHKNIRDTAFYKPLRRLVANGRTPSLKRLTQAILGKEIQTGEHNSVEDARAVMSIYNCLASDWEQYIRRHQRK